MCSNIAWVDLQSETLKEHCPNPIHALLILLIFVFVYLTFSSHADSDARARMWLENRRSAESSKCRSRRRSKPKALKRQSFKAASYPTLCTAFWILSYSVEAPRTVKVEASRSVTTLIKASPSLKASQHRQMCAIEARPPQSALNAFDINRLRRLVVRDFHSLRRLRPWTVWSLDIYILQHIPTCFQQDVIT